ncbi:transcriptional antiterminator Rof [Vibrio mediterranei]|uniref:Rho-binding antiterminator n=1 Tax=Vibrio mediterranei TaxID=689 RepID=UPI000D1828BF|nr:Rho-binding antiterminator [Vibrio mediterranei]PTC03988.1 transcriptional antiterminator Rof [Vibrio mediterranei]
MISCSDYDYIEIACMYRYPVKLTMKVGLLLEGIALDTVRDESNNECLKLNVKETDVLVILDEINKLEVLVENPHFSEVVFK